MAVRWSLSLGPLILQEYLSRLSLLSDSNASRSYSFTDAKFVVVPVPPNAFVIAWARTGSFPLSLFDAWLAVAKVGVSECPTPACASPERLSVMAKGYAKMRSSTPEFVAK
eukprot:1062161-Amphidinium_carterae.1